jgi:hypothetical protein
MDVGGIAMLSLLGALVCPLLLIVGFIGRWLPRRTLAAKVRQPTPRRVS